MRPNITRNNRAKLDAIRWQETKGISNPADEPTRHDEMNVFPTLSELHLLLSTDTNYPYTAFQQGTTKTHQLHSFEKKKKKEKTRFKTHHVTNRTTILIITRRIHTLALITPSPRLTNRPPRSTIIIIPIEICTLSFDTTQSIATIQVSLATVVNVGLGVDAVTVGTGPAAVGVAACG